MSGKKEQSKPMKYTKRKRRRKKKTKEKTIFYKRPAEDGVFTFVNKMQVFLLFLFIFWRYIILEKVDDAILLLFIKSEPCFQVLICINGTNKY